MNIFVFICKNTVVTLNEKQYHVMCQRFCVLLRTYDFTVLLSLEITYDFLGAIIFPQQHFEIIALNKRQLQIGLSLKHLGMKPLNIDLSFSLACNGPKYF